MLSEFLNLLYWVAPFFLFFILLEFVLSNYHNHRIYKLKDLMASGAFGIGTLILTPIIKAIITTSLFYLSYDLFNPLDGSARTNILGYLSFDWEWYVWLGCMLVDDFIYYWFHRLNHTVRFLWAAHIVHHSSKHFNFGTGIRNGWFTLFYKPLFYIWIPALGFRPEMAIICMGIESLWQFQLHTRFIPKLGFLESFLNTHTMHQVHHAQNIEYLDKNHGGILNVFDKIFGSWKELDNDVDIVYGVLHDPKSYNPWLILTHEYKNIFNDVKKSQNIYQAVMFIFGEPGWSPDKSSLTVKEQQKLLKKTY